MALTFAQISFTPNVQAVQSEMGSRTVYRSSELGDIEEPALSPVEQAFITERDSFYQATVSQTGWPYVQHRGGPAGFLKVLDARTIGYADFSGNRQYISVGNLRGDERVSLVLMDYPQQRRLKIWGRARTVSEFDEPQLLAQLESPDSRAPVERGIVIRVEAFDWNCPKYITPRYSQQEVDALLLRAKLSEPVSSSKKVSEAIGSGALALTVVGLQQLTPGIRSYELQPTHGDKLPPYRAGAHIRVPVAMPGGSIATRTYSLAGTAGDLRRYRIAVLRNDHGFGGSRALHEGWQLGTQVNVDEPVNHFSLHQDRRPALLIAGGIGITPIMAMASELAERGLNFQLHYAGKTPDDMAFIGELQRNFPDQSRFYFSQTLQPNRLNVSRVLGGASADTVIYVCGPVRLTDEVRHTARRLGIAEDRVQSEQFT